MAQIRLALVIGGEGDEGLEVVDITKVQTLSPTIFIIETKPFKNSALLSNGAGDETFTIEQIRFLLSSIHPDVK